MERPEFESIKDYDEFCRYYWYREELIEICKVHGLKHSGSKIELNAVIKAYFSGEKILPEKKKSRQTKAVVKELTLQTGLIECGFTFGNRFREFFSEQTGIKPFKFNVDMVETAKVVKAEGDVDFTLGDLLDIYHGKKTYAKYDKSALQWNQFVKDFCADEATKIYSERLKAAAALWKIVRESDMKKEYSHELLEKYKGDMRDYSVQNKKAWEFDAYDFWVKRSGTPEERAAEDVKDPIGMLRKYARYFDSYDGVKIANICGSCGKKAIPLALLGAKVTVFDISEDNKRYAIEVAKAANTEIEYVVGDVLEIDQEKYSEYFDVVFMEGGILHYFHDIDEFMKIMNSILKKGGKIICSDFHPFTKINDSLNFQTPTMSYFSTEIYEGEMAHARFYDEEIRKNMPKCSYRKYTISEILNSMIKNGFVIKQFDEHPSWVNENLPGEFTAIGIKD